MITKRPAKSGLILIFVKQLSISVFEYFPNLGALLINSYRFKRV